jgi:hypothetical protein
MDKKKEENKRHIFAYVALCTSLIPIIVFLYCLIESGGSGDESGAGAVWWLMFIYCISLGVPVFVISVVFAALGINSKKKKLAIISLAITLMPVVLIIVLAIITTIVSSRTNFDATTMHKEYKQNSVIMMNEY